MIRFKKAFEFREHVVISGLNIVNKLEIMQI